MITANLFNRLSLKNLRPRKPQNGSRASIMGVRKMWPIFVLCFCLFLSISSADAEPGDPFHGASDTFAALPEAMADFDEGDWGVGDQRGAAIYTFPIELPPGRRNMAPSLALRYSSQAPLRGGLAAGWTLDLPHIVLDTSLGYEDGQTRYRASLGDVSGRLLEVPDEPVTADAIRAYRLPFDTSFARFYYLHTEEGADRWLVLTPDGIQRHFGGQPGAGDGQTRWNITSESDPFGNTISYHWAPVAAPNGEGIIDYTLKEIEYTTNDDAGLGPHARVVFSHAPLEVCSYSNVPVGAAPFAGKPGTVLGAERLTHIRVYVRDEQGGAERLARETVLTYELSAAQQHYPTSFPDPPPPDLYCTQAPLRLLTAIDVTAYNPDGVAVSQPPITFDYNRRGAGYFLPFPRNAGETGYFQFGDSLFGAKITLMDLDGDGLRDRVAVAEEDGACKLFWKKGTFGGGFESNTRRNSLPTVPWYNEIMGNSDGLLNGETCNLNGQIAYRPSRTNLGGIIAQRGVVSYNFLDYNADGRLDLLTSVWAVIAHDTYVPGATMSPPYPPGPFETEPLTPQMRATGTYRHIWRVHGDILHTSTISPGGLIYAPRPLPRSGSEENLGSSASIPPLVDLDGDGFLDIVDPSPEIGTEDDWVVFFGNGNVAFDGDSFSAPYSWRVPDYRPYGGGSSTREEGQITHTINARPVGLEDFNGDGLVDLLVQQATTQRLTAYLNDGRSFSLTPIDLHDANPLSITQADIHASTTQPVLLDGFRGFRRRPIDLDGDGWRDVLILTGSEDDIGGSLRVFARYNLGDRFGPIVEMPAAWGRGVRLFESERNPPDSPVANWHVQNDLFDVNGDGLLDLAALSSDFSLRYYPSPGLPQAVDLLRSVDNGRGLTLDFEYGLSTNLDVVEINSSLISPHYLPRPTWVVTAVEADAGFDTPPLRTEYGYSDPVYSSEESFTGERQRQGFSGFATTFATVMRGDEAPAREVVRTYAYDASGGPAGKLVGEDVYFWVDGRRMPQRFTENVWQQETLFDGEIPFAYLAEAVTRTCAAGESADACRAQVERIHRVNHVWTPLSPSNWTSSIPEVETDGVPQLFAHIETTETNDDISFRTAFSYQVRYGQGDLPALDYRVQLREQTLEEQRGASAWQIQDRKATDYDEATGLPLRRHQYVEENSRATTRFTYDEATGLLMATTKPEQAKTGGSGNSTLLGYDSHMLFVVDTTNELGHETFTGYDVATGALLQRFGPNSIVQGDGTRRYQEEVWDVDGFGRTLSYARSLSAEDGYALHTVSRAHYDDFALPNLVRKEDRLNADEDVWITLEERFDGMGRSLDVAQPLSGGRSARTSYTYNSLGELASIETPDPRDDAAIVQYHYEYDGGGRLVRAERPDGSGVAYSHDGLQVTVEEVTVDGSGSLHTEETDVFGRLVKVVEFEDDGAAATTRYSYDANDNLTLIEDAEGQQTLLQHDLAGRRTAITRGERTWRYVYDANGNIIQQLSPLPAGANPADYTISRGYDDLDRITSLTYRALDDLSGQGAFQVFLPMVFSGPGANRQPAPAQPAATETAFETITYSYDQGVNGIGRLSQVTLPVGRIRYEYDARGLVTAEERQVTLNGLATLAVSQHVERGYNLLGLLTHSRWEDGQAWRVTYDNRGKVDRVEWLDPRLGAFQTVADYERSLAGLPLTRRSDYGGLRTFSYDALGRVIGDQISYDGAVLAERQYTFTNAGDVAMVSGHTNQTPVDATYTYDRRHRLLSAGGPDGYEGHFTYSPAGNIMTAEVSWNGGETPQNVRYEYGGNDPQAVTRLVDRDDGATYATFAYDMSGNMVHRETPDGGYELSWNGLDQLQVVQGPEGRETYFYDHDFRRMLAVSEDEGVRFWFAERETHFSLTGEQTKQYLHLLGSGPEVGRIEDGASVELQYADALQNLLLSHDETGDVTAAFHYGPFGEILESVGGDDHRRQFNGKEHDAVSGLRYYGYRYYDPLIRRWNAADPLFRFAPELGAAAPQQLNLYAFSLNNPVRFYDPDGLAPKPEGKPKGTPCSQDGNDPSCDPVTDPTDQSEFDAEAYLAALLAKTEAEIRKCKTHQCVEATIQKQIIIGICGANCPVQQQVEILQTYFSGFKQLVSSAASQQHGQIRREQEQIANDLGLRQYRGQPFTGTRQQFNQHVMRTRLTEDSQLFDGTIGGLTAGAAFTLADMGGADYETSIAVARAVYEVGNFIGGFERTKESQPTVSP